jgi:hypothetical protein
LATRSGFNIDEGDDRFGAAIVLDEISIDGGLQGGDRVKDTAADALRVILEKKFSTALRQELEVGVKWKVQRG